MGNWGEKNLLIELFHSISNWIQGPPFRDWHLNFRKPRFSLTGKKTYTNYKDHSPLPQVFRPGCRQKNHETCRYKGFDEKSSQIIHDSSTVGGTARLLEEQLDCWRNRTLLIDVVYEPKKNAMMLRCWCCGKKETYTVRSIGFKKIHQNTTFNPCVYYLPAVGDQEWIQSCADARKYSLQIQRGPPLW